MCESSCKGVSLFRGFFFQVLNYSTQPLDEKIGSLEKDLLVLKNAAKADLFRRQRDFGGRITPQQLSDSDNSSQLIKIQGEIDELRQEKEELKFKDEE